MSDKSNSTGTKPGHLSLTAKTKGALLGAAVGDALGWPHEMRRRRNGDTDHAICFFGEWPRRTGSRFYSHIEVVGPGEYSDDTQLILSTFRALRDSDHWVTYLAEIELPCWLIYERGGGHATKSAAESWAKQQPPWKGSSRDRRNYFQAGGNGVAMRILPHCALGARESDFRRTATMIVANGVLTHGHPRALVGALAYGYVLWSALRSERTLSFGGLVTAALADRQCWQELPDLEQYFADWLGAAEDSYNGDYHREWSQAVEEQVELLEVAATAIKKGALSQDEQVIEDLGCFNPRFGAAGTRTAAAAVFLASRFAAEPTSGLLLAACTEGTDTDTIASMTGGILGALAGGEWLSALAQDVQDEPYLLNLVDSVLASQPESGPQQPARPIRKPAMISQLERKESGDTVVFPDGREARICDRIEHEVANPKTIAFSWKLQCRDGQTLFVKRLGKHRKPPPSQRIDPELFDNESKRAAPPASRVGVKVFVEDLPKARNFYEKALGLQVQKQSSDLVNFAGRFTLMALPVRGEEAEAIRRYTCQGTTVVYIEMQDPKPAFESVKKLGTRIITQFREESGKPCFRCLDPAGNLVEVYRTRAPEGGSKKEGVPSSR